MKSKNKLLKSILPACLIVCVLSCALIIGSVLASENNSDSEKLNLILSVPSKPVPQGQTFTATVKISNSDVTSFKIAGLQVDVAYNYEMVSVDSIAPFDSINSSSSYASNNDTTGHKVKFACVSNSFTNEKGYETLGELFTIRFTANTTIDNPAMLFDAEDITFMIGDVDAEEIKNAQKIYGADKASIAEAIVNSEFVLTPTQNAGTVVVAESGAKVGNYTIKDKSGNNAANEATVGTGFKITANGEDAYIVVKGDLDGDGKITVFDAMIVKKALEAEEGTDSFNGKGAYEFAGDLDGNGATNTDDVQSILENAK